MSDKEYRPHCDSHQEMEKHVIKVAEFMGQIGEANKNSKADINVLFDQNRKIIESISDLKTGLSNLRLKVLGLGAAGAFLIETILHFIKKIPWGK